MAKSNQTFPARTYMKYAASRRTLIALLAFSVTTAALAQYSWTDEKGTRQYSDRPPPAGVPQSRILKQPGKPSGVATVGTPASDTAQGPAASSPSSIDTKTSLTTAEKNADFQRRRAEQAEKQKKADEDQKLTLARAANCERAGEYKRVLESGERVARSDKNGERTYLTDEQRARELRDTKQVMSEDCK
jgi:cell division protein FtsN